MTRMLDDSGRPHPRHGAGGSGTGGGGSGGEGASPPAPGLPPPPRVSGRGARRLFGDPRTGPAPWVLAVAVFGAVMGASLGLKGVLFDLSWLPQAAVVVAGTLLIPAVLRRYPTLGPYAPLGALAGWFMTLTLVFFPATALLGVVPTSKTVTAALQMASEASKVIMGNNAPVPSVLPMFFLICAGLGFAALLIDTVAITVAMPAASSLGLVLILLPSALTTTTGLGPLGFSGAAAGFLLVLGCCRWYAPDGKLRSGTTQYASGTLSRAAALGAAAVLLMLLAPAVIPGFTQGSFPQGSRIGGSGGGTLLDPMISLGDDLRSQSSQVNLTYLSNTDGAQYLRLSTLEDFTGKSWKPSALPDGLQASLTGLSPEPGPAASVPRTSTLTQISIAGLGSDWLPAPLSATAVDDLRGRWLWNPATQTFKGQNASTTEQTYLVRSEMPILTPEILGAATGEPTADLDPIFMALPRDVPQIVSSTAQEVTAAAPTPYARAMALQEYLRSGDFTYSLSTPVAEGYDGSGMEVLAKFLDAKAGYCVHFSAAMAVMAREVGIPSRIVVGYAPGTRTALTGELAGQELLGYEATGQDAHAWPELYFEGLGWVPFEPTPSRGSVPDYAQEDSSPASDPLNPDVPIGDAATTTAPTALASTTATPAGSSAAAASPTQWLQTTVAIMLVLLLLTAPALARVHVRRRRLAQVRGAAGHVAGRPGPGVWRSGFWRSGFRRAGGAGAVPGDPPEVVAWRELLATAVDLGYSWDAALTPARHAEKIARLLGSTTPADLALVLHAYEQSVYGSGASEALAGSPGAREDLAAAVETLIRRLRTAATPWGRFRAALVPTSFLEKTL